MGGLWFILWIDDQHPFLPTNSDFRVCVGQTSGLADSALLPLLFVWNPCTGGCWVVWPLNGSHAWATAPRQIGSFFLPDGPDLLSTSMFRVFAKNPIHTPPLCILNLSPPPPPPTQDALQSGCTKEGKKPKQENETGVQCGLAIVDTTHIPRGEERGYKKTTAVWNCCMVLHVL